MEAGVGAGWLSAAAAAEPGDSATRAAAAAAAAATGPRWLSATTSLSRSAALASPSWRRADATMASRAANAALVSTSAASLSVKAVRAAANCWRKSSTSVTDAGEWSEAVVDAGAGPCEPPGLVLASAAKGVTLMPMMVKCVSVSAHQSDTRSTPAPVAECGGSRSTQRPMPHRRTQRTLRHAHVRLFISTLCCRRRPAGIYTHGAELVRTRRAGRQGVLLEPGGSGRI